MVDDTPPRPGFAAGAGDALRPVAGQVHQVRHSAEIGGLLLDPDAARLLLTRLAALRARVDALVTGCAELDQPLRFGDNWVAGIMSDRLHGAAATDPRSASLVMGEFQQVMGDLEATVRAAAGIYTSTDQAGADDIRLAARRLGLAVRVGEEP